MSSFTPEVTSSEPEVMSSTAFLTKLETGNDISLVVVVIFGQNFPHVVFFCLNSPQKVEIWRVILSPRPRIIAILRLWLSQLPSFMLFNYGIV